ncbi:imidazole glycerol phosphate synthase cyclase subunit [Aquirufa antheringensis]|uniref:imidazole glycerol phosphate synthase cyclase subunit n=1 Tax=Aquirufa antheringensis TaxID=2516559 RepID=UPI0022A9BADE|nr:imidazole glycerol phosphate synthase cyclase subunit [Aquirufa antheringensis]MCZ2484744.1 imidazole glycerol phosphate synthase cyclase subunit [Aquirufa antheringensis]
MLKKRLIFTLLIQGKKIVLSRNFTLQTVGNIEWVIENFNIDSLFNCIDELVIINTNRSECDFEEFCEQIANFSRNCFMPISAGGGIVSEQHANQILNSGADKIIINTILFNNPQLVIQLVKKYGSQCIVASIDYKLVNNIRMVFTNNGTINTGLDLLQAVNKIKSLGVGELYITSIDRDGTGLGYDIEGLKSIFNVSNVPIIASGGIGKIEQFSEAILSCNVDGVSTANLFNFVGDALSDARNHLFEMGIEIAEWEKVHV